MKRFNKKEFDRDYWLGCAGDDVMSVIRFLDADDWKRLVLIEAHAEMVYHRAHRENASIDFDVKNASWVKPSDSSIAGRIAARARLERQNQLAGSSSSQSAGVPPGDAVSIPSPAPILQD